MGGAVAHKIPKPIVELSVCGGSAQVRAWGVYKYPKDKPYNWSLRLYQKEEYELARELLLKYAKNSTLWAPVPVDSNGLVVCPKQTWFNQHDLATETFSGMEGIFIRRGVHADGVVLHSVLDAYLLTPADCATVILSYKDSSGQTKVIAGHGSRNSLINAGRFNEKVQARAYEGIIESALTHVPHHNISSVQAWIGLAISPGPHFPHRNNDSRNPHNGAMLRYLQEKYGNACFKIRNLKVGTQSPFKTRKQSFFHSF